MRPVMSEMAAALRPFADASVQHSERTMFIERAEAVRAAIARYDALFADRSKFVFAVGDHVEKYTGDYSWRGTVCAAFETPSGHQRYVVAHPADSGEVLHIYGPNNLRHAIAEDRR
jgi:hypothetical protein